MKSSDIEYQIDGVRYVGHMAEPDGTDLRPAVLVCHEAPGLTDHAKGRARRIADELGYVAFALDYWGDGKPLPADTLWPTFEKLRADKALTRQRATAGLDVLLAHPRADRSRVASIGWPCAFASARTVEDADMTTGTAASSLPHIDSSTAMTGHSGGTE